MPSSTAKNLATLSRFATKFTANRSKATSARAKKKHSTSPSRDDDSLKKYLCTNFTKKKNSTDSESAKSIIKNIISLPFAGSASPPKPSSLYALFDESLKPGCQHGDDESGKQLSNEVSTLLHDGLDLDWEDETQDKQNFEMVIKFPWLPRMSNNDFLAVRKKVSRERKQKWVYKNTKTSRFDHLVKMCANKLGPDAILELFGRLGRETGLKEYNALISLCIQNARNTKDEEISLREIYKAYQLFETMKEMGFEIVEETYGQFLMYLIDVGMIEEFEFFCNLIQDENPDSLPRLAYYEMLLWIRVDNEVKMQDLFRSVVADNAQDKSSLQENILLALCEMDRKEELLVLLETFDITKVASIERVMNIFKSLGKLLLEAFAEKFLLALKSNDVRAENISKFICEYAVSIPNLAIEDTIDMFKALHTKLALLPTSAPYERLIRYSCELHKVHEALNMVDEMFEAGLTLSLDTFHSILNASEQSCDYNLVHQINSMIYRHDLKPNIETFKRMINLFVKMKDFQGAYGVINDLMKMSLMPTATMYNAIMAGYFREKNTYSGLYVLKQMEEADVKPDPSTFGYLISNCNCEEDIMKFYGHMLDSGVQPTKQVFMALINAYASCGQFEKAKQVILDERIPVKGLNEIKSVLVSALASNGQLSDALKMYEDIKEAECNLKPKAIRCLIEHLQSKGELNRSLQLLEELNGSHYWVDACFLVISYCVHHEDLRCTVDLLKQLKDKFINAELATEALYDEVFCLIVEKEATNMQFGLNLLQAIKNELGVFPSRKSLDFLLSACVNAKDVKTTFVIWKEYEIAGLPYNVLSFIRMYQALLASGDWKSARNIRSKIPNDDPHVRSVVKACEQTYIKSACGKKEMKQKAEERLKLWEAFRNRKRE